MEEQVREALSEVRAILQQDGGDLELVGITDDNYVKVKLQGHCVGCPGAQMTLHMVVEQVLQMTVPEVAGVIEV